MRLSCLLVLTTIEKKDDDLSIRSPSSSCWRSVVSCRGTTTYRRVSSSQPEILGLHVVIVARPTDKVPNLAFISFGSGESDLVVSHFTCPAGNCARCTWLIALTGLSGAGVELLGCFPQWNHWLSVACGADEWVGNIKTSSYELIQSKKGLYLYQYRRCCPADSCCLSRFGLLHVSQTFKDWDVTSTMTEKCTLQCQSCQIHQFFSCTAVPATCAAPGGQNTPFWGRGGGSSSNLLSQSSTVKLYYVELQGRVQTMRRMGELWHFGVCCGIYMSQPYVPVLPVLPLQRCDPVTHTQWALGLFFPLKLHGELTSEKYHRKKNLIKLFKRGENGFAAECPTLIEILKFCIFLIFTYHIVDLGAAAIGRDVSDLHMKDGRHLCFDQLSRFQWDGFFHSGWINSGRRCVAVGNEYKSAWHLFPEGTPVCSAKLISPNKNVFCLVLVQGVGLCVCAGGCSAPLVAAQGTRSLSEGLHYRL